MRPCRWNCIRNELGGDLNRLPSQCSPLPVPTAAAETPCRPDVRRQPSRAAGTRYPVGRTQRCGGSRVAGWGQSRLNRRTCAKLPPRRRPRPERARKANKDVLVSALLEAQEGGNQCSVNGKRENRSGKTVYFQAGEGFVNSTGHCGGSTAGHKTPRAEERSLSEPRSLRRPPEGAGP